MCQFVDDRLSDATRLAFVHQVLQRDVAETRFYLNRMQQLMASLDERRRSAPVVAQVLEEIARDQDARGRLLDFARHHSPSSVRVQLLELAHSLGWLTTGERKDEMSLMLGELQTHDAVGIADIDLACTLSRQYQLDGPIGRSATDDLPHAALRACLGSASDRERTLQGLLSLREADVQIAQAYLRQRPISDNAELRRLTAGVVAMPPSEAQTRALETLARQYVSDPEVLQMLTGLFAQTTSWAVQAAVASILLRADRSAMAAPQVIAVLLEKRLPAPRGDDIIDALIRRLRLP
jgi:hypothetical protein